MSQCLFSTNSFLRIKLQHPLNQILNISANIFPFFFRIRYIAFQYLLIDIFIIMSNKGRPSSKQNIQDDANRPNITLIIVFLLNDLRSYIVYLSLLYNYTAHLHCCISALLERCAHPKVYYLYILL